MTLHVLQKLLFSIVDLVLFSKFRSVEMSVVTEPSSIVIFTFKKPLLKSFSCEIRLYNQGDFNMFWRL